MEVANLRRRGTSFFCMRESYLPLHPGCPPCISIITRVPAPGNLGHEHEGPNDLTFGAKIERIGLSESPSPGKRHWSPDADRPKVPTTAASAWILPSRSKASRFLLAWTSFSRHLYPKNPVLPDGMYGAEDLQNRRRIGTLLEIGEAPFHAIEPLLALDQKLACQFFHRACFLPHRLKIGTGSQGIYRTCRRRLEKRSGASVFRGRIHMIHQQDLDRTFAGLEFKAKLLLQRCED